ncbi:hypothetical protein B0A49_10952 [Cryomyces minteri]|uniref:DUF1772-domain-containing protein n=1 Tax=Cryomyces minteri TaxID=331657 RepID=A0A4V5ND46_9PEZI|nr:hypothetical protein B0A49_10952 [Cryomyces minteri]
MASAITTFQSVQVFSTIAAAVNFGGSILQSPLIMPMLMLPDVPTVYAGKQTAYLLHNSEYFFPPLNLACTLSNLILTGIAYYYSPNSPVAPRLAFATVLNFATTAYALGIMVPMNRRMAVIATELEKSAQRGEEKGASTKANETELRRLQSRWRKLNYGRATIMIGSALAGMSALLCNRA